MDLSQDLSEFIKSLNSNNVDYVIVGGFAQAFHGRPRFTGDIDILIRPSAENAARLQSALSQFGFGRVGLREEQVAPEVGEVVHVGAGILGGAREAVVAGSARGTSSGFLPLPSLMFTSAMVAKNTTIVPY